ncbi:type II toxin-antitoxin system VapC family toxin [Spirosoma rhododendri]|uniref:PIN domain-containing protein n=1 Tax=Spirosoma rhododendri TaxID=2728024 RepID=A0A7L5DNI5_9BACT|nr:PIN domain-containing protein [Spirosoma rhododendri]QJD79655.1 PIN domain-containing protein [Spirosoma rhododendri]
MNPVSPNSFVLVDTGVISRYFLQKPQIVTAYNELMTSAVPVLSASIYIELMRWLVAIRGRTVDPITKSEFATIRRLLDNYVQLNHGDCLDLAVEVSRLYPDTGLDDCFTIGVGLFFDVPIFTLNQKHFDRVPGVRLYRPSNYALLETN